MTHTMPARKRVGRKARAERERAAARREALAAAIPYLSVVKAPSLPRAKAMGRDITVASYNVHRWVGLNGTRAPDPARAGFVISELAADVIALVVRTRGRQQRALTIAEVQVPPVPQVE